jgi:hypothetical protein
MNRGNIILPYFQCISTLDPVVSGSWIFQFESFPLTLEIVLGLTPILKLSLNLNLIVGIHLSTLYWPVPAFPPIASALPPSGPNVKGAQALDLLERVERPLFSLQPGFGHPELSGLP